MEIGKRVLSDWINMNRIMAIMVIDGKWYESDINHQECLLEWQNDWCEKTGNDIDTEEGLEAAIQYTNNLFKNNEAYGFDVFEGSFGVERYIVAHYQNNLLACWDEIQEYAKIGDMEIGTFINFKSAPVIIERYEQLEKL